MSNDKRPATPPPPPPPPAPRLVKGKVDKGGPISQSKPPIPGGKKP